MLVLATRTVKEPGECADGTAGDATEDRSPGLGPRERVVPKAITRAAELATASAGGCRNIGVVRQL
jgi:hypothetical protein